jgi:hypothetical protein
MTQRQFVEREVELETRATVPNCWPAQNMTGLSDQRRSKTTPRDTITRRDSNRIGIRRLC